MSTNDRYRNQQKDNKNKEAGVSIMTHCFQFHGRSNYLPDKSSLHRSPLGPPHQAGLSFPVMEDGERCLPLLSEYCLTKKFSQRTKKIVWDKVKAKFGWYRKPVGGNTHR
jgi:hypothetical protein